MILPILKGRTAVLPYDEIILTGNFYSGNHLNNCCNYMLDCALFFARITESSFLVILYRPELTH
jgi:hypothetical protein